MQPENLEVGVLAEEFGHNFFGLLDLYTKDAQNSIGFWSIMFGGAWGGWLSGSAPVGKPLWFQMIARCGPKPCNWQEPMLTRDYRSPEATVTIGQLEDTPNGVNKGVRINRPEVNEATANRSGAGKAAYIDKDRNTIDIIVDRSITIDGATAGLLQFDCYWDIESDWDYGYFSWKKKNRCR